MGHLQFTLLVWDGFPYVSYYIDVIQHVHNKMEQDVKRFSLY